LNKACPKDEYPLPRIYQIVDFMASCELLSFLDAYLGYHQISLVIDDEEKIAFITPFGIFYYTKMAFRLKNEGATYQKCVHIILENQIGRSVEAYIEDIVVKPLAHVLQSKEATKRITQWAMEIGQYDIEFVLRRVIKS
jgi:hypothetical protein